MLGTMLGTIRKVHPGQTPCPGERGRLLRQGNGLAPMLDHAVSFHPALPLPTVQPREGQPTIAQHR